MTLNELIKNAEEWVAKGYGDKKIVVEEDDAPFEIDSIQSDTKPGIEPNYLFITQGAEANLGYYRW